MKLALLAFKGIAAALNKYAPTPPAPARSVPKIPVADAPKSTEFITLTTFPVVI